MKISLAFIYSVRNYHFVCGHIPLIYFCFIFYLTLPTSILNVKAEYLLIISSLFLHGAWSSLIYTNMSLWITKYLSWKDYLRWSHLTAILCESPHYQIPTKELTAFSKAFPVTRIHSPLIANSFNWSTKTYTKHWMRIGLDL